MQENDNINVSADNGAAAQGILAEVPQAEGEQALRQETAPPPKKDYKTSKAFSDSLNRLSEKKVREAVEEAGKKYRGYDDVMDALRQMGYEGGAAELAQQLKGLKLSDAAKTRIKSELIDENPAIVQARKIIDEQTFQNDLQLIKTAHPECTATDVLSLGDVFLKLMATGTVDAVTAYEAQIGYDCRSRKDPPVSAGSLRSADTHNQKEYYSPEEAKRITRRDLKENPRLMERVRKSMVKWQ